MTKSEKVKMAIWMFNRLIDMQPEIYQAWKKIYLEEKDNEIHKKTNKRKD